MTIFPSKATSGRNSPHPGSLLCFYLLLTWGLGSFAVAQTSSLVYEDVNGDLQYGTYANQGQANSVNTIPDYSNCGYKGGGETVPFVPAVVTVSAPTGGDDTTLIQDAIDQAAAMPIGGNGFRGAVLIKAGNYQVASTLNINASGIVLRGEGSQASGGTTITMTATVQDNLFEANGIGSPSEMSGSRVSITDAFVPSGSKSFNVSDASSYSVGDEIQVHYKMNDAWIQDLGMHNLTDTDSGDTNWTPSAYQFHYNRTITAIDGNTISIDAPLVQTIEDQYGGADIYRYTFSGQITNVGFEALRLESTYSSNNDEDHGWIAIRMDRVRDGWIRQVTGKYFGYGLVTISGNSSYITVEDCAMVDPKSQTTGGRKYSFNINTASFVLMQRCYTWGGRHDFVTGARVTGPNVFVDCLAENTQNDSGPHHRYSTGQLYDNIKCGPLNVHNRLNSGTGHGWTGAQILLWNCDTESIICDTPPGAMNWSIGSKGTHNQSWGKQGPDGFFESHSTHVTPRSLYYRQLQERLGPSALENTLLPAQYSSTIWDELSNWAGNGLLLDPMIVAYDSIIRPLSSAANLQAIVRRLDMLDNGSTTITWSKVTGPGTVSFGDASALETTATFSAEGQYELQILVDDGTTQLSETFVVWASDSVSNQAPQVDAGADQIVTLDSSGEWPPEAISTAAWYDASDANTITTDGNGGVSEWSDKSGHGNHALQTSSGNRPASSNNRISFDHTADQHLDAPDSTSLDVDGSGGVSIFAFMNYNGYVDQGSGLNTAMAKGSVLSAGVGYGIRVNSSDSLNLKFGEGLNQSTPTSYTDSDRIVSATREDSTTTGEVYIDGSFEGSSNGAVNSDNNAPLRIGGDTESSSRYSTVDFGEIIIVSGVPSEATRQRIEGYMAHKWGLTASLPSDHPYRNSGPTLGVATATLNATVNDSDGASLTTSWSLASGPAEVAFSDSSSPSTTVTFTLAGTYTLRLTADDEIDSAYDEIVVQVGGTVYESWSFSDFQAPFPDTDPDSNPDGDALNNLLEFAFGLDPTNPSNPILIYVEGGALNKAGPPILIDDQSGFLATFTRRKDHASAGLAYTVEFSADLKEWTASGVPPTLETSAADPGDYEVVSVPFPSTVPVNGGGAEQVPQFFRIQVIEN